MAELNRSQIRTIEEVMAYPRGFGYVLDFSDRTMAEFFDDEFGIDIEDKKYSVYGTSKRNRLSTFIKIEEPYTVAKVLRALWDRREGLMRRVGGEISKEEDEVKHKFLSIIASVEGISGLPRTDALECYERDRTLEELIADIERDLQANKPEVAMDHLHTYCMKKFTHLLKIRGIECNENEPLHSRFGKYHNELINERDLKQFTIRAMKSAISLFESFNDIRNNHSLAHDKQILEPAEARYIFDSISGILIFLRAIEVGRYDP